MAVPVYVTDDVPSADEINDWFVNVNFTYKPTGESLTSNAVLQDDNNLTLTVDANAAYICDMALKVDGPAAGDFQFQFTMPSGAAFVGWRTGLLGTATDQNTQFIVPFSGTGGSSGLIAVGTATTVLVGGLLTVDTTAGSLTLQWAQAATAGTATTVQTGSYLRLTRVS